jgi:hypothetical protein
MRLLSFMSFGRHIVAAFFGVLAVFSFYIASLGYHTSSYLRDPQPLLEEFARQDFYAQLKGATIVSLETSDVNPFVAAAVRALSTEELRSVIEEAVFSTSAWLRNERDLPVVMIDTTKLILRWEVEAALVIDQQLDALPVCAEDIGDRELAAQIFQRGCVPPGAALPTVTQELYEQVAYVSMSVPAQVDLVHVGLQLRALQVENSEAFPENDVPALIALVTSPATVGMLGQAQQDVKWIKAIAGIIADFYKVFMVTGLFMLCLQVVWFIRAHRSLLRWLGIDAILLGLFWYQSWFIVRSGLHAPRLFEEGGHAFSSIMQEMSISIAYVVFAPLQLWGITAFVSGVVLLSLGFFPRQKNERRSSSISTKDDLPLIKR